MKVISMTENEDGSANLVLDMTEEEKQLLIEYAVVNLIEKFIEDQEKRYNKD